MITLLASVDSAVCANSVSHGRPSWQWLVGIALLAGGCGTPLGLSSLDQAKELASNGQFQEAEAILRAIPRDDSRWPEAQLILGDILASNQKNQEAIQYYESVPQDGSRVSLRAIRAAAELHFYDGLLHKAEELFQLLIERYPEDRRSLTKLAQLYEMSGLRNRAEPILLETITSGRIEVQNLVSLSEPDRPSNQAEAIRRRAERHPDDYYVQLGLARVEMTEQKFAEARQRVAGVIALHPEIIEAQALYGELLLDGELSELQAWHAKLPDAAQNDPGVWFVRGLWARRLNQPQVAARCFWETVRQSPVHRRACFQLGQVLAPLNAEASAAFSERAAQLKEYAEVTEQVLIHRGSEPEQFSRMVTLLAQTGRVWEAWAWVELSRGMWDTSSLPEELMKPMVEMQKLNPPRFREDSDLSRKYDLSTYPDFRSLVADSKQPRSESPSSRSAASIRFADTAADNGIEFAYFQSPDPESNGVRIFESTGGGVGAFDFDQDGLTDLFFTQGQDWPRGAEQPVPSSDRMDCLFRGTGSRFENVTVLAGLSDDPGYGQGCSCGDFNNDGFPDLYVANIGQNRLWQNNGDGTFTDISVSAGLTGSAWTTSCLILDLNLDGNPDLYDVNYLQGEQIFSVECSANRCSVKGYEGAPDQVLLSRGDGTFVDVPDATPQLQSKSLGVVAMFVKGEPRPSLFIANDQVPNYFLRPTEVEGRYADEALLAGLAVNHDGMPTACMGVAAGDLNRDRKIDLFVTNYQGESKVLFLQREDGFFEDAIQGSGLMIPGIPYVGWGTQFLDADNNGDLDLVSANGHVADFGEPGVDYQMPTQFFRNQGRGQMTQLPPAEVGELFGRAVFGRGLALCDWNRDGRMEFALSNIDAPAILATNQTEGAGHWLTVQLHATTTARDAIGATVELHQGEAVHWRQQLAGDGYQASNERCVHFGLGTSPQVDRLVVTWPSGTTTTFTDVPADRSVTVIEGRKTLMTAVP